ncbi:MAG: outer membrane protein [Beijerinckiaceae bacterium]
MRTLFAAAALASLVALQGAVAADLPSNRAPYSPEPMSAPARGYVWTGFYAGVNAGYSWGSFHNGSANLLGKPSGAAIGGQIGYNHQMSNFVIGVEGDIAWNGGRSKKVFPGPVYTNGSLDWSGSLRARAGFAADRALVYATGGYGFAQVKGTVNDTVIPAVFNASSVRHGWTGGLGIEYAFTNNISAKAEYLYASYGSKTIFALPYLTGSGVTTSTVRAGVNYHF